MVCTEAWLELAGSSRCHSVEAWLVGSLIGILGRIGPKFSELKREAWLELAGISRRRSVEAWLAGSLIEILGRIGPKFFELRRGFYFTAAPPATPHTAPPHSSNRTPPSFADGRERRFRLRHFFFHRLPPLKSDEKVVSSGETHSDDCTWRSEIFYHTTHRTGAANGSRSTCTCRRRSQPPSCAAQPPGRTVVAASQRRHRHNTGLVQTIEDAELVVPLVLSGTRRPPV
ncbi:disease resistance protein [Striga asiatica]|uniref:Disease resistance protein n=1 Tax=Striga asiatica TaxID=4170 RepID=A0A5A7PI47_STRAF|nr:disease resistance protein [Striga asiatica]